jgi:AcrR family transcriptional regulator
VTVPPQRSTTRRDLISHQILEHAAALFAERGFSATSMRDVAEALEISRTALYHYIGGKDELLETLVRGITQPTAESLERLAADTEMHPTAKITEAVRDMVARVGSTPARFRLLLLSEGSLPEPLAGEHREARRRTLAALARIIDQGVVAGQLRAVESNVAAFAIFGMCNWVAWWYSPDRGTTLTPERLGDEIARIALQGLVNKESAPEPDEDSGHHALRLIQEQLGVLTRALESNGVAQPPLTP